jgi:L-ascorbate metabolism protein UlaG (beta-lactamase superfamily)
MKFTFYGHATFLIEVQGKKLLFDPFFTGNPSAKNIDVNSIEADYIFISHGHGDHTGDVVSIAKRTGAMCIAPAEAGKWLGNHGIEKVSSMNHGGPTNFEFGKVRCVNAVHSSSFNDGTYAGNPVGFVVNTPEGDFYYAGDTALTMDMQLIPLWAKLQFAILPIGSNFTMDVADAIHCSNFIQCKTVIGVHYNTWEIISINTEQSIKDFTTAGKTLLLPKVGETITV